ncbi:hypothetical protein ANN_00193 [Periplaneta americana]|uniref:Uncharacterized protein n=1 Tax=Periplaneta americana TaxID=6978 RepID=A0ABQ8TSW3_PERAM|nr:hypothetical protein ANN_00193 [Periplaneta americana]
MDWLMSPASVLLDLPGWYLAAVLGTGFFTYYLFEVVKSQSCHGMKEKFHNLEWESNLDFLFSGQALYH